MTRDRRTFTAHWGDRHFLVVDTGGWELDPSSPFSEAVRLQAEAAVSGADAVLFVVDGTAALGDDDEGMAAVVKKSGIPGGGGGQQDRQPPPGDDRLRLLGPRTRESPSRSAPSTDGEWEISSIRC